MQNGYFGFAVMGSASIHFLLFWLLHIADFSAKQITSIRTEPIALSIYEEPQKDITTTSASKKTEKRQKIKQIPQEPRIEKYTPPTISEPTQTAQIQHKQTTAEEAQPQKQRTIFAPNQNSDEVKRYLSKIRKILQENLEYPHFAKKAGVEGVATVCFCIKADGSVSKHSLRILKSSGSSILDVQALETVQSSIPFAAPPKGEIEVSIPVSFAINS